MGLKAHASTLGLYASLGDWFKKGKPRGPSTAPSVAFAASCSARDDKILFGVLIAGLKAHASTRWFLVPSLRTRSSNSTDVLGYRNCVASRLGS